MDELTPRDRMLLENVGEEYYRKYGASIEFLKNEVGEGDAYENEVARAMVSPNGAWCECRDLPAEFTGATGSAPLCRLISEQEALAILSSLSETIDNVRPENSRYYLVVAIYSRAGIADRRGIFLFQHEAAPDQMPHHPITVGAFRPGVLPRYFRCRLDTDLEIADLDLKRGVAFFVATQSERHLLAILPYTDEDLIDLGEQPPRSQVQ